MSYPTDRDALARHLYVYEPLGPEVPLTVAEQAAGAEEWDMPDGVKTEDRAGCYARADRILAGARS
ncbi:MAG TPA: hypothetical protein VFM12_06380 [Gemmatimonadales bacterium]|nr:hypothetical protein [Gemmatimonadales bacterium]